MRPPFGARMEDVRREGRERDAPEPGERAAHRPAGPGAEDDRDARLGDVPQQAGDCGHVLDEHVPGLADVPRGVPLASDRGEARDRQDRVLHLLRGGRQAHRPAALVRAARLAGDRVSRNSGL